VIVVLDASVILKWLLEDPAREPDTEKAFALVESVVSGRLEILQPVHWLAEVAAVAAHLELYLGMPQPAGTAVR
jgi:predicted nucleic acid-binding protein